MNSNLGICGNENQDYIRKSFKDAMNNGSEALRTYLCDRAKSHLHLYHYTSQEAAKSIIESNSFLLNKIENLNDMDEEFPDDDNYYFLLSFSCDQDENLGMWYTYGRRIAKENNKYSYGVRLGFHNNYIACLINNPSVVLYDVVEKRKIGNLKLGQNDIVLSDVVYGRIDSNSNSSQIVYCGCEFYDVPSDFFEISKGFVKKNIWKYEFETRLVVRVKKKQIKNNNKNYRLKISIPSDCTFKQPQILLHPEKNTKPLLSPKEYELISSEYQNRIRMV